MDLDILCEVDFTDQELREISEAADRLGLSVEQVIRSAVKSFTAECVPTQETATEPAA